MGDLKIKIKREISSPDFNNKTENEIIEMLSAYMADSMIDLLRPCIEQRLKQFLPLIKKGLTE